MKDSKDSKDFKDGGMVKFWTLLWVLMLAALAVKADASEFRRALPGYKFDFPRDHGAHRDFRTEWWYFTGNLTDDGGKLYGFELTIFRNGLTPKPAGAEASPLIAREVFLGHFAISDDAAKTHTFAERVGRPGFGQGSAADDRLDVRMSDWVVTMSDDETITVKAVDGGSALDLKLTPEKPLVIHGTDGVHQKSEASGQASHYYSYTRLAAKGSLTVGGKPVVVSGLAWMDHEFFSDQIAGNEVGWDWFAIQLESGEDLMVYQLRKADGTFNEYSNGSQIDGSGVRTPLPGTAYAIKSTATWTSEKSGATYPSAWNLSIPGQDADLRIEPIFPDQEMLTTRFTGMIYWEGAVKVTGTWKGKPAKGRGFVELVGYAKPVDRRL